MKLLLDEQVPARLAQAFPAKFTVKTVQEMGWASVQNGALLQAAAGSGFEALISADKNIEYQQNPENLPLPVIVLGGRDNRLSALEPLVPKIVELLNSQPEIGFHRVNP